MSRLPEAKGPVTRDNKANRDIAKPIQSERDLNEVNDIFWYKFLPN